MDPPDAYSPPAMESVPPADLHPYLRQLSDEHASLSQEIKVVEEAIRSIQASGCTGDVERTLARFFQVFERDFIPHSRQEEVAVFPLLNERLIASGEHSNGPVLVTAVDVMRDEHVKALQLAAAARSGLKLASRVTDQRSRLIVLEASLRQTMELIEVLRLHMFREDNIVFASAHRLITGAEFDAMPPRAGRRSVAIPAPGVSGRAVPTPGAVAKRP
jgi:hemerythrin-like domain-containing protein